MNIENINKYIVQEVYGGKYGEWIDYPEEEKKRTRKVHLNFRNSCKIHWI